MILIILLKIQKYFINIELQYSFFQMVKILNFMGLDYTIYYMIRQINAQYAAYESIQGKNTYIIVLYNNNNYY
jgi:hypothetical protein